MKVAITQLETRFKDAIFRGQYKEAIELILLFVKNTDKHQYLSYIKKEYDWKKYFRNRKYHFKKYGYFVYGKAYRQVIFQFVRPCRRLTMLLFKDTKNRPREFFHKHLDFEERELLKEMSPRAAELFDYWADYKKIGELLSDDKSQYTYACILMAFLTMKFDYFEMANCNIETEYLPADIFAGINLDCMVDCGGYDGDTALKMFIQHSEDIKSYYLMEADSININKAKDNLKSYRTIKYIEAAVMDKNGFVYFNQNGASGMVSESGTKKVKTVMLDDVIPEKITHLKMDIEGSELAALRGCRNHIQSDMPNMSICAYHKPEDIRELTEYVLSINPKYHVYLRHYGDKHKELVLYFSASSN